MRSASRSRYQVGLVAHGRTQRRFGLGTAALLERDIGADPDPDLLGDLCARERCGPVSSYIWPKCD